MSEDFFNAEATPTVTFRSTDITVNEDGSGEVAGELTIRGVTKPVVAKGNVAAGADPSATSASPSSCRRPSTAASSASTGRTRSPTATTRSPRTSR